eukprot:gnl/Spiro4/18026_TR9623_c0_g1_i1.p1 gnl/Spiro4/18026_TR9623_c0_g1~~gnl/Spiro4/18026_TR9623_c0_g1_i1.p1  ORF type:complete len:716 (+),score=106.23 gnl/Spiro4/18026_TR9623_c0_g1_i1:107-2149(+)
MDEDRPPKKFDRSASQKIGFMKRASTRGSQLLQRANTFRLSVRLDQPSQVEYSLYERFLQRGIMDNKLFKLFADEFSVLRGKLLRFLSKIKVPTKSAFFGIEVMGAWVKSDFDGYNAALALVDKLEEQLFNQMMSITILLDSCDPQRLRHQNLRQLYLLSAGSSPRFIYIHPPIAVTTFLEKLPEKKDPSQAEKLLTIFNEFFEYCKLHQQEVVDLQLPAAKNIANAYVGTENAGGQYSVKRAWMNMAESFIERPQLHKEKTVSRFTKDSLAQSRKKTDLSRSHSSKKSVDDKKQEEKLKELRKNKDEFSMMQLRPKVRAVVLNTKEKDLVPKEEDLALPGFRPDCSIYMEPEGPPNDDLLSACPCDGDNVYVLPEPEGYMCMCMTTKDSTTKHKNGYLVPVQKAVEGESIFPKFTLEAFQCILRFMYDPENGYPAEDGLFRMSPNELLPESQKERPFHPISPTDVCYAKLALGLKCKDRSHSGRNPHPLAEGLKKFVTFEPLLQFKLEFRKVDKDDLLTPPDNEFFNSLMQFLGYYSLYSDKSLYPNDPRIKSLIGINGLTTCFGPRVGVRFKSHDPLAQVSVNSKSLSLEITSASQAERPDFLKLETPEVEPCTPFGPPNEADSEDRKEARKKLNCFLYPECAGFDACGKLWKSADDAKYALPHKRSLITNALTGPLK